ncbi:putative hemolysin [Dysgonomonas sp. PH5-45]|uniref:lysophospholipid acyltransferase family protein n=1 Tax=unclassified Dysgonomonas TaxID=2630389 RepID=UPI00247625E8|nr:MULTISPECIES: lysophospholipid acyltransferase family protein [unclassified Dysgonomonas]MDH6354423.1 putative hemolysin [Dysgonomonas sp. PH5-45]MDH6387322.1 putative hemolysin [Dysgonomonas sp. PH5-37]
MKEKLLSKEDIQKINPIFRGRFGNLLIKLAMRLTGMNKVNRIYDASKQYEGVAFCDSLLKDVGVNVKVENLEVLKRFEGKPFVTVSNHAYGHIDGIIAIDVIGSVRPDYKMMVNFILAMIDTMAMHFIAVNPYSDGKLAEKSSLEGVKECIEHLKNGHPLGFFPAGAVSKTKLKKGKMIVEDRDWQSTVIKLIQRSKVPVIPMYFTGGNSWFFNFLDLVDWRLRSLRLGHEVYNKRGKTITVRLGEPIMPEDMAEYNNTKKLGEFLKQKTYSLAKPRN